MLPQTAAATEFFSPTHNISCEIDYRFGSSSLSQAFCLTVSPPQSATLNPESSLAKCSGVNCLANAGLNTPVLPYATSITLGPFTCLSLTTGMRCTLANGNGFIIATSGVTPLGRVAVTTATSG